MAFHPFCWVRQVSEKLVDPSIRENRDSCGRYVKVAEKLACMVDIQWLTELLTFDQHLDLAIFENGIVDLFTFLGAYIANEFWYDFGRVENVISQYGLNKWHDECRFCCLFR
jgi:hypothetical protein